MTGWSRYKRGWPQRTRRRFPSEERRGAGFEPLQASAHVPSSASVERRQAMRLREHERYDTLYAVRDLVQQGNWVAFDSETTSLEGEIISWAVAAPDGTILGQG